MSIATDDHRLAELTDAIRRQTEACERIAQSLSRLEDISTLENERREAERREKTEDRAEMRVRMQQLDGQMGGFGAYMNTLTRSALLMITFLILSASKAQAMIKVASPLRLFVRDATQIVQVKVTKFDSENNRLVFDVEQDIKGKIDPRTMNVVWKFDPDSKWEGIRTLPRLLKSFGPEQQAILFINDTGGFWHNKGNERKNPIAFGFINGSWFCLESTKLDNGKLLWRLAQGEPYLRTTFKGTTTELNKVLVDHLAGKGKLPDPTKEEPGFGPEYQRKK